MKFFTHNDATININLTSLQGYIQATRAQLEKTFGAPEMVGVSGDRVTTHWSVKFADETVATIYDWKRQEQPAAEEHMSWHIGGMTIGANVKVHDAFREAHGLNARAA